MKAQIESITPVFAADSDFVIPMKSVPPQVELSDELPYPGQILMPAADRFEFRGVPDSALHD